MRADEPDITNVLIQVGTRQHETSSNGHTLSLGAPCPEGWWDEHERGDDDSAELPDHGPAGGAGSRRRTRCSSSCPRRS